jgi:hypothetical protein
MEVLFTLLAERYERRSVVITSNLVFSQWDRIFKDPMTARPSLMAQFRQQYDAAVAGQNGSLEPKISGFRCFIAWGGLAWAIASNNPWGIAGGLYDVGCSCFGWCF